MKSNFSINSALVAGLASTAAMTLFTFMAPLMGISMDIPKMLASTMGAPIIVGWIAHFMIGIILAISFAVMYVPNFSTSNKIKTGAIFSLFPWLIAQILVMPMMSIMNGGTYFKGFFSGSIILAAASLMGHLVFGVVLGFIYKTDSISELKAQKVF
ncbi:Hypothetical protein IALB_1957 [Ignavibacterium album JCM 16511]|uniref:DUF3021 domain-containing protein n=1 Tax=Ignavibacterium album (strain DSM 19864 / JCM 16511 / NBRC 101810 / Mat9-16) TaxID=945713 RepID=I0AL06_IGNAJ|nr:DUF6789 family protein [Ignavibacterium album]AFH49663.1 Hypothetical protein IALB_1957 [Ignavibacterium album JCM 16511]